MSDVTSDDTSHVDMDTSTVSGEPTPSLTSLGSEVGLDIAGPGWVQSREVRTLRNTMSALSLGLYEVKQDAEKELEKALPEIERLIKAGKLDQAQDAIRVVLNEGARNIRRVFSGNPFLTQMLEAHHQQSAAFLNSPPAIALQQLKALRDTVGEDLREIKQNQYVAEHLRAQAFSNLAQQSPIGTDRTSDWVAQTDTTEHTAETAKLPPAMPLPEVPHSWSHAGGYYERRFQAAETSRFLGHRGPGLSQFTGGRVLVAPIPQNIGAGPARSPPFTERDAE